MQKRWTIRTILWGVGLVVLAAVGGFIAWGSQARPAMPAALEALRSDAQVQVRQEAWLVFEPAGQAASTGLIFYPGGRVDYRAYAPAGRAIAGRGYQVVIVPMPLNLAVLDAGAAAEVMAAYPQVQHWVVGGHSLGGAMAANFAKKHLEAVEGLVLWAAYPAGSDDLNDSNLQVVSISGTLDGLATGEKIAASRSLLPANTEWVTIEGGNHAQFGWYGDQPGDNPAAIDRPAQQEQVIEATIGLLQEVSAGDS